MLLGYADDPRMVWVGYPEIAGSDRFAIADEAAGVLYMYVPLDMACRWFAHGPTDKRALELRFHATPEHDTRLAQARDRYSRQAALALDQWDHAPKGRPA